MIRIAFSLALKCFTHVVFDPVKTVTQHGTQGRARAAAGDLGQPLQPALLSFGESRNARAR